ncbi:MAG: hypothetical protein ACREX7_03115 [Casimicrobiaceae bacterium]
MAQMQGSAGSTNYAKCAHPGCKCDIPAGKRFCSAYCEQNVGTQAAAKAGCGCGHAACRH